MKKLFSIILLFFVQQLLGQNFDKIIDPRDGHEYKIVQIGNQWWTAENIDFNAQEGSWYFENESTKYNHLGRFYTFETAKESCPGGWHLPTDEEWKILEIQTGLTREQADAFNLRGTMEGEDLKAKGNKYGDNPNINATNKTGFSAIGSGYRNPKGDYKRLYQGASFWTSTAKDGDVAWFRTLHANRGDIHRGYCQKKYGYNVRCIKNDSVDFK